MSRSAGAATKPAYHDNFPPIPASPHSSPAVCPRYRSGFTPRWIHAGAESAVSTKTYVATLMALEWIGAVLRESKCEEVVDELALAAPAANAPRDVVAAQDTFQRSLAVAEGFAG